jgi:hypothetical protein
MAWEACRIIPKNICLTPRIHLDRRVSRLPEWLAEARQLCVNGFAAPYYVIHWLAVLAHWRPLPNECTQADGCAHLQDWFHFWNFSARPIAAQALLNLAGGSQPPHDICPEQLLESIARQVGKWHDFVLLAPPVQDLLLSPPIHAVSPEKLRLVVAQWLKLTMPENAKGKRQIAWEVLAAWQRKAFWNGVGLVGGGSRSRPYCCRTWRARWSGNGREKFYAPWQGTFQVRQR